MLRNNKGLTVLELIVSISLSSLVLIIATQIYLTNAAHFKVNEQQAALTSIANQILTRVSEIGLESSGISTIQINGEDYLNKNLGSINEANIATISSIESLTFEGSGPEVSYDENTKVLKVGTQIFEDVTQFIVMPIPEMSNFEDANGVKVLLEVESTKGRQPISYEATTIIGFRNK